MKKYTRTYKFILILLMPLWIISCQKDRINVSDIFDEAINQKKDSCYAFLPNAFTPNSDGKNELLRPLLANIKSSNFEFTVRNESQKIQFTTDKQTESWDGDDCPTGRYIATLKGEFESGGSFEQSCYVCLYRDCVEHRNVATLEFESMFDPITGSSLYPSGENICP